MRILCLLAIKIRRLLYFHVRQIFVIYVVEKRFPSMGHFCSLRKHTRRFCLRKSDLPVPDVTVIVSGR
jgi:hypothetical protein